MRWWLLCTIAIAAAGSPADQAAARWTLLEGGRVGIGGRLIDRIDLLPAGDFQLELIDWVAVNAVPEDLERLGGLRYLRELRLPGPLWNRNADGGKDLSKLLKFLAPVTTLEKLTFSDHFLDRIRFKDAGLNEIAGLTQLRELALRQAEVRGPGLRHFVNLQSLDVTLCPLTDLGSISAMKDLRRLWAADTLIADLRPLAGLTALEDLDLRGTLIGDGSIPALSGMRALRRLDLQGTDITDSAVSTLERLTNLESLNLYRTKISNGGLARLSRLPKLQDIDVRYTRVTSAGYESLRAALPRARIQFAGGNGLGATAPVPPLSGGADAIAAWVQQSGGRIHLKDGYVSLAGIAVSPEAVRALRRIPGIRILDLNATGLDDTATPLLAGITTIEELILHNTQISDTGLRELGTLPNLKRLGLNNTYVDGTGFEAWPAGAGLEELSLLGTPANDAAMMALVKMRGLRRLVLAETDVTAAGLAALTAVALTDLDLSATDVGDDAPLEQFSNLRFLRLRDTRISDLMLARKLGQLTKLETLDLARTRISNAGIVALRDLTALRSLDLSYSELDDEGLRSLSGLRALEVCKLDSTHLTDAAVPLLSGFTRLQVLDLYHTLISAAGHQRLRAALPSAKIVWDPESALPYRRRA